MSRNVEGLKFAAMMSERPKVIPIGRPRGIKAKGIAYEKALAGALPSGAQRGAWFEFRDINGGGYCQPDYLVEIDGVVVILECKYTWTRAALLQLNKLYLPVVAKALNKPTRGIVVCKVLVPDASGQVCGSLEDALAVRNGIPIWHWLGIEKRLSGARPRSLVRA